MAGSRLKCLICVFALLAGMATRVGADDRGEWQHTAAAGVRRFTHEGDGRWVLHFPNGATADLEEVERTEDYVQLLNSSNGNLLRLFADRGAVRKGGKGNFRKFSDGNWVAPAVMPRGDYQIQLVYFVPADREPIPEYAERIRTVMRLVARMMTDDLVRKGYDTKGPQFRERGGDIDVAIVRGKMTAREYNGLPVEKWPQHQKLVGDEVQEALGSARDNMYVIFAETYETGPSRKMFPGHVANAVASPPLGGRACCSAWILQDEFFTTDPDRLAALFFDTSRVEGRSAYDDKSPNSPRFELMEDGYGAVLHEFGHIFGLTHHRSEETNVMGGGFRDIRWNVAQKGSRRQWASFSKEHGWLLMTSRYLNSAVDRTDDERPHASLDIEIARDKRSFIATVEASDDKGLAYVSIIEVTEKQGRQLLLARKVEGRNASVKFRVDSQVTRHRNPQLLVMIVDAGGNHRQLKRSLVESPGGP